MNVRFVALAAALSVTTLGAAVASAQAPQYPAAMHMRGDRGSDRNLRVERRRIEAVIDGLQRHQHDYNGHRVRAIQDLQQARAELDAALQADRNH